MKHLRLIGAGLIGLMCCACTSTPIHYYTLMRPLPAPSGSALVACCHVQIRRVVIPPQVDRPELVTRSGNEQANVLSNAVWLAPLRDEIRGALMSQINWKLHDGIASDLALTVREATVFVDVTRFESVPTQYVLVSANWRIQWADLPKVAPITCETAARITVGGGMLAVVQGYQQALVTIADRIARDLLDAGGNAPRLCASN